MLDEIIKQQKIDMLEKEKKLPLNTLLSCVKPSDRDFLGSLKKNKSAFIFECKHRSPSEGMLSETYPVIELAQKYAQFANAISVLTNQPYFGGNFEHLKQISETVNKPILCKDIIINPYQVVLARYYGADAVLLMLSVLNDEEYLACHKQAKALNMDVLTEVFTEEELIRACSLNATLIGINHRNFHTMQLDMARVKQLSPHFPKNAFIIAASGIKTHQQIHELSPYANGFLIGSSLSKSENINILMRELIFGAIKICGLTRQQDVQQAFKVGASYGGFIFAENSPRKITLEKAKKLVSLAPLHYVGVFVQQSMEYVAQVAQTLNLYAVQLHGGETQDYIKQLRLILPSHCHIWLTYAGGSNLPHVLPHAVDKIVLDKTILGGGGGKTFNWEKLKDTPLSQHIMLGGGLNVENIQSAQNLGLWGLDINSGVESIPGIKDDNKLEHLFFKLREKEESHVG
ncbi:MAG: bifunctional indole-3-glycerol-phosphate synthase TrpC/phosphoribosylanthranilate isomerase TrpF [Gammaproteobacteria bacterium]|nr:bifunctional indole-3-glycerol-phosphate synthase TrpC/phosphoribosylanthranilate isomerase TrpF [Gammaproteobacteria bacterium]